ncbi:MAG TPA: tetratricopeptide repeat protein [Methylomirabilota bacterium]|jgi:tetratricopeptide (TPR) repeat protein
MTSSFDRLAIGRLALRAGALREALTHFRVAATERPDAVDAHRAHADAAALLGEFAEAVAARRRILTLEPSARTRWELGLAADYAGERPLAIESLEACLQDGSSPDTARGGVDPAEHLFRMHLEAADRDAALDVAHRRGWLHADVDYCTAPLRGLSSETQGLLAVLQHPHGVPCAPALALGFADTGNVNLARFVALTAIEHASDPDVRDALTRLVRRRLPRHTVPALAESLNGAAFTLHHALGQSAEAIRVYLRAIAVDPAFSWPYRNIGVVYLALEEYADAAVWLEKSVAISPEHSRGWAALAAIAYEQRRFEEALEHYRRAAELDPNVADYHGSIGTCLIRLGRRREALDPLRAAALMEPANTARRRFYDYHVEVEAVEQA